MRNHPLTPMKDANLVHVLNRQMKGSVGLVPYHVVENGIQEVRRAWDTQRQQGHRCVILDALNDNHLMTLGAACADLPLITGGSGMSMGLPENFRRRGLLKTSHKRCCITARNRGPSRCDLLVAALLQHGLRLLPCSKTIRHIKSIWDGWTPGMSSPKQYRGPRSIWIKAPFSYTLARRLREVAVVQAKLW